MVGKIIKEMLLIKELELTHKYESHLINSAIAITKELIENLDREHDIIPNYSKSYIQEKISVIQRAVSRDD